MGGDPRKYWLGSGGVRQVGERADRGLINNHSGKEGLSPVRDFWEMTWIIVLPARREAIVSQLNPIQYWLKDATKRVNTPALPVCPTSRA